MTSKTSKLARAYSPDEGSPLGAYAMAMGVYGAVVSGLAIAGKLTGRQPPARVSAGDFVVTALATHKLSRIITKDAVTSPMRAPFVRYKRPTGASELMEEVRADDDIGHGIGELLTCPFCLSVWVSTALAAGTAFAPQMTRAVTNIFAITAASDMLQFAYDKLKDSE